MSAAVAVRVERIKLLARREPGRPASDELSPIELRAMVLLRFGKSGKTKLADGAVPTLGEATTWLAQLCGDTGKSDLSVPRSSSVRWCSFASESRVRPSWPTEPCRLSARPPRGSHSLAGTPANQPADRQEASSWPGVLRRFPSLSVPWKPPSRSVTNGELPSGEGVRVKVLL